MLSLIFTIGQIKSRKSIAFEFCLQSMKPLLFRIGPDLPGQTYKGVETLVYLWL